MTTLEAFLVGDRPDDVVLYLSSDAVDDVEELGVHGEVVDDGVVLVVDGDRGRSVFKRLTGTDVMGFAGAAMGNDGEIDVSLTDGTCPSHEPARHTPEFVFAFAEAKNEDVGGIYAEGAVIHAYALCSCGTAYSDRWVAGEA